MSTPSEETRLTVARPAALQRETILPTADRGRLAAVVATCSLAGLAGGMVLAMVAEGHRAGAATRAAATRAHVALTARPITWLGVRIETMDAEACTGVRVLAVTPGSPAAGAGLRLGDVVTSFGGRSVCSAAHLQDVVRVSLPGAQPEVGVRRGAEAFVVQPRLAEMPARVRAMLPPSER